MVAGFGFRGMLSLKCSLNKKKGILFTRICHPPVSMSWALSLTPGAFPAPPHFQCYFPNNAQEQTKNCLFPVNSLLVTPAHWLCNLCHICSCGTTEVSLHWDFSTAFPPISSFGMCLCSQGAAPAPASPLGRKTLEFCPL